jgi:hypothetical protein
MHQMRTLVPRFNVLSRRPLRLPLAQLRPHQSRDPHRGVAATANNPAASDVASLARIKLKRTMIIPAAAMLCSNRLGGTGAKPEAANPRPASKTRNALYAAIA